MLLPGGRVILRQPRRRLHSHNGVVQEVRAGAGGAPAKQIIQRVSWGSAWGCMGKTLIRNQLRTILSSAMRCKLFTEALGLFQNRESWLRAFRQADHSAGFLGQHLGLHGYMIS